MLKLVKFIIALLLLPACAALTLSAWELARLWLPHAASPALPVNAGFNTNGLALAAGYALWLAIFVALPKPMRTYVLGHELTHALWAMLMGARVSGLKVAKTGGQVRTSKSNWLITLAPYFFPFYAMLFIGLFFLSNAFWSLAAYGWVLFLLIGFGWSFHVTFTLMMLLTVRQPDVKSEGLVFSAVMIYLMNLLFILITAALLARNYGLGPLAHSLAQNSATSYAWTLDKAAALWQYAGAWVQRKQP